MFLRVLSKHSWSSGSLGPLLGELVECLTTLLGRTFFLITQPEIPLTQFHEIPLGPVIGHQREECLPLGFLSLGSVNRIDIFT